MINAEKIISDIINNIGDTDNTKVIRAYPSKDKPTKITKAYIAVGIKEIKLEPYQIDYPDKAGEITLSADLYCPLKWDSNELTRLFSHLCSAVKKYNITSISTGAITADMTTQAYLLKTTITLYNKFDFGGDGDGQRLNQLGGNAE